MIFIFFRSTTTIISGPRLWTCRVAPPPFSPSSELFCYAMPLLLLVFFRYHRCPKIKKTTTDKTIMLNIIWCCIERYQSGALSPQPRINDWKIYSKKFSPTPIAEPATRDAAASNKLSLKFISFGRVLRAISLKTLILYTLTKPLLPSVVVNTATWREQVAQAYAHLLKHEIE